MKHRIAAIPGDGIGKDVVPEGRRVIDAAVQFAAAPTLRAPARLQHHAQDTVDAEPGVRQRRASMSVTFLSARARTPR